jgi:cytoskeletal protein CcmA (bactofilin family)
MPKTVDQFSTIEQFRNRYNDLANDVGDISGLRTENQETLVDAVNSLEDKSFFFQEFVFDGSDGASGNTVFSGNDNFGNLLSYRTKRFQVYVNGVHQIRDTDFSIGGFGVVSPQTYSSITFSSALNNSDVVTVYAYTGSYLGVVDTGAASGFFTQTAAQTIYNTNDNGVIINGSGTDRTTVLTDVSNFDIELAGDTFSQGNVKLDTGQTLTAPTITDNTLSINQGNITGGVTGTFSSDFNVGNLDVGGGFGSTGVSITSDGHINANGNVDIDGTLNVDSATTLNGTTIDGDLDLNGSVDVSTNATVHGNLDVDGTTELDHLNVDGATTLNGTTIDGDLDLNGSVDISTNLTVHGNATINGNLTLGNQDTDSVSFGADIHSHILPNASNTYDLGSDGKQWRNLYIDGTAEVDTLSINGTTVTSTAAEINKLDGYTGSATELNYAKSLYDTGVTASEFDTLDGITSTTAELNKLDGFTGVVADLNYAKDLRATGVTSTEFDYLDGVTSNIQSQLNLKAPLANASLTGTTSFETLSDGSISITAFVDEDNMASNSASLVPTQQSVKAYVDSQVASKDHLSELGGDSGNITEGSNLFFTNARADARADLRIGAADLDDIGNVDVTGNAIGKVLGWDGSNWVPVNQSTTTDSTTEGNNKYFTDDRVADIFKLGSNGDTESYKGIKLTYADNPDGGSDTALDGEITAEVLAQNGVTVNTSTNNVELDYEITSSAPSSVGSTSTGHLWLVV